MGIVQQLKLHRRRSRGLVSSLILAGVFPRRLSKTGVEARQYAWSVFCIFSFSYVIIFTMYNLLHLQTNNFMVKVSSVKTSLSALMCLVVLLVTMFKSDRLVDIIQLVDKNFWQYSDEDKFPHRFSVSQHSERVLMYGSGSFFVVIYCSAVLSHPLYLLFNRDLLKSGSKMLTHTWVPFKGDTVMSFYMAHTLLFTVTFSVVLTIAGSVCFSLHVYLEFRNQFERMGKVFETLEQRIELPIKIHRWRDGREGSLNSGNQMFTPAQARMFDDLLIECVKHYQLIRECFHNFENWFSLTYSIVLIHSVVTLAMMSYGALLNINNFGVSLKYVSVLLVYTGQVYMYCYTADRIYETNENLAQALLGVPWYRQPPQSRKIFYIFLCEVQRPFRLMGFNIYPASLNVFTSIMKLSYSYLNLLRTYGSSSHKS